MDIGHELGELFASFSAEMGAELRFNSTEVADYAAQRAAFLSTLVGQPGYQEAVIAERDNVALKMGTSAVSTATAADARLLGIVQGVLGLGARALANLA